MCLLNVGNTGLLTWQANVLFVNVKKLFWSIFGWFKPLTLLGLTVFLSSKVLLSACDTPVFRYALERWTPSIYPVLVFHKGTLSSNDNQVVKALQDASIEESGFANYAVARVDLETEKRQTLLDLWKLHEGKSLPWVMVRYADSEKEDMPAWDGPLTAQNCLRLINSPVREEAGQKIGKGNAVAWLLLEYGDKDKDLAAFKNLEGLLKETKPEIELPADTSGDSTNVTKLTLSFPIIRISRNDPRESFLVSMLLHPAKELLERTEPMVIPVFGRGRALAVIAASQLNKDLVASVSGFLLGACSCEVKEQNPGFDLLLSMDWDSALMGKRLSDAPPAGLVSLATLAGEPSGTHSNTPATKNNTAILTTAEASDSGLTRNVLAFSILALAAVAGISVFLMRSKRTEN